MADRLPELKHFPTNKGSVTLNRTETVETRYETIYQHYLDIRVPLGYRIGSIESDYIYDSGETGRRQWQLDQTYFQWFSPKIEGRSPYGCLTVEVTFVRDYTNKILRNAQGVILRGANGKILFDA